MLDNDDLIKLYNNSTEEERSNFLQYQTKQNLAITIYRIVSNILALTFLMFIVAGFFYNIFITGSTEHVLLFFWFMTVYSVISAVIITKDYKELRKFFMFIIVFIGLVWFLNTKIIKTAIDNFFIQSLSIDNIEKLSKIHNNISRRR